MLAAHSAYESNASTTECPRRGCATSDGPRGTHRWQAKLDRPLAAAGAAGHLEMLAAALANGPRLGMHSRTISIQLVDSLVFVALRFMPDDDCRPDPSAPHAQLVTLLVVTIRVQGPWGTATRSTNRQETLSLSPLSSANPRHPFSAGETSMPAWL